VDHEREDYDDRDPPKPLIPVGVLRWVVPVLVLAMVFAALLLWSQFGKRP
jgi:hypothetical protein